MDKQRIPKTLQEIKALVKAGHRVYWKTRGYYVFEGSKLFIVCEGSRHFVGLFHSNGIDSDYAPSDFFY